MKQLIRTIRFYSDGTYEVQEYSSSPPNPMPLTPPPIMTDEVVCPKCGLRCKGAMGYVCSNNPCPLGMGGVWC